MTDMQNTLTIVVPCYNEEEMLPESAKVFAKITRQLILNQKISPKSKILFVDDGSTDQTWHIIKELEQQDALFSGLKFSRNFGHQNALLAGMQTAVKFSDWIVTIDCDLQDDPQKIFNMVNETLKGNQIVYGVRKARTKDSWFKLNSAELFYTLMQKMGVNLIKDHADFRLMSKKAVTSLLTYTEEDLFLRGIVPKLGYQSSIVYYDRAPRMLGESKYPLKKMLQLAFSGLTSLTDFPLKFITGTGLVIFSIGMLSLIITAFANVSALTLLNLSLWTVGGMVLFAIGLVGIYTYKALLESKRRPHFLVEVDDYTPMFQSHLNLKKNIVKQA